MAFLNRTGITPKSCYSPIAGQHLWQTPGGGFWECAPSHSEKRFDLVLIILGTLLSLRGAIND